MSDLYSYSSFKCAESDPAIEWFFCMIVMGVMLAIFCVLYIYRIFFFYCHNMDYSFKSLLSRVIFALSLACKSSCCIITGFGYSRQTDFSVFKYLITDLPDLIVVSALSYILYSWCQVFLYCGASTLTNTLSKIQTTIVLYNSFIYGVFSIFFCLRCTLTESSLDNWRICTTIFLIIANIMLTYIFVMVLIIMKKQLHFTFSCNLGNPEHYLFTLCCFFIIILLFQAIFNIVIFFTLSSNASECTELNLILTLCTECIGQLLPLGFISIVDVISLPPPEAQPAASIFDD